MASSAETGDWEDLKSELEIVRTENNTYRLAAAHMVMKNEELELECERLTDKVKTLKRELDKMETANALLTLKLEGPDRDAKQAKT